MVIAILGAAVFLLSVAAHAAREALGALLAKALAWLDRTPSLTVTVTIATPSGVALPRITEALADIIAADLASQEAVAGFRVARGPLAAVAVAIIAAQSGGGEVHPGRAQDYAIGVLNTISMGLSRAKGHRCGCDRTCSITWHVTFSGRPAGGLFKRCSSVAGGLVLGAGRFWRWAMSLLAEEYMLS